MTYDWPGNVRELRNALERASILCEGPLILPQDLPSHIQHPKHDRERSGSVLVGNMKEIQRQAILEALEKTGGNKTKAAELLGIGRRTFIYKLRDYGM
jgi:DNA-binding NtrC family response regulator